MKKKYISPQLRGIDCCIDGFLMDSRLDATSDNPVVTPTETPYDGEFSGRGFSWGSGDVDDEY